MTTCAADPGSDFEERFLRHKCLHTRAHHASQSVVGGPSHSLRVGVQILLDFRQF